MKKLLLPTAAALSLLASGLAFAESPYTSGIQAVESSRTRAEVKTEAATAVRAGDVRTAEGADTVRQATGTRSRADVAAEARAAARQAGQGFSEVDGFAVKSPLRSVQTSGAASTTILR